MPLSQEKKQKTIKNKNNMQIDFRNLIEEWNQKNPMDKTNQSKLAREMVANGILKTEHSAKNMIQYHQNGKAKSVDFEMLIFLCNKFKKEVNEIIK